MSEIDIRIVPRVDGIYDIFYHMDCVCDMWWWSLWMWEYSGENCEKKRECNTNTKLTWEVIEISWAHWLVVVFGCPLAPANDYTQFSKSLFAESLHSRRTCRPDRSATFDPSQRPIFPQIIQVICQFSYVKVLNRSKHEKHRKLSKNIYRIRWDLLWCSCHRRLTRYFTRNIWQLKEQLERLWCIGRSVEHLLR